MRIFFKNFRILSAALLVALVTVSCTEDEEPIAPPSAGFTFEVDATNPLSVIFTNATLEGETFAWDFGDGAGTSADENPTYTYAAGGTYSVKLTATNEGGSTESIKEVTVIEAAPENQIKNGTFDDDSEWTIIAHNASGNGSLIIADGVAIWDEAIDVESGSWGNEAHMGLYQMVTVEAGTYQFDLDITINGFQEVWFEVWVGTDEPVAEADYSDPAVRVLSASAWDCQDTQGTYSGSLAANACHDTDGKITLDAGNYYMVIRSGGFTFGEGGIVVDNVSMKSL